MTSSEVLLRLTHDYPLLDFSRRNPSFRMLSWCNRESLVHEIVVGNPEQYSLVMSQFPEPARIVAESYDTEKGHVVLKRCPCKNIRCVAKFLDGLAILHIQPTTVEKGWEYHRLIVFKQEDLRNYLERIEEAGIKFEILRKAPIRGFAATSLMVETNSLFSHLTQKQTDALMAAHRNGYYAWPRKTSVKAIASYKHVPKTTFRDHLRKAESKLITGLMPYLYFFNREPKEKTKTRQKHELTS